MVLTDNAEREKVQVWIYARAAQSEFRFLLLQTTPARGMFWQPVTGSVEPFELIDDAALREAKEETGLSFPSPPWSLGHEFSFEARGLKFHEHVFAVEVDSTRSIVLDPREHSDFRWVSLKDANQMVKHASNVEALGVLVRKLGLKI